MALPKAVLCVLDEYQEYVPEEAALRNAGFATVTIFWGEIKDNQGWTQLRPILDDPTVQVWAITGKAESFDGDKISVISLLTLAMTRPNPPVTAFILRDGGEEPEYPELLGHIKVYRHTTPYAAKLMAAKVKPVSRIQPPFHVHSYLDPLIGIWLEVGPRPGETWQGFMAGVIEAEVLAFGVGPRGTLPTKSTLQHPRFGIKGNWGGRPFVACEAQNPVGDDLACYMKIEGLPRALFRTDPEQEEASSPSRTEWLELA